MKNLTFLIGRIRSKERELISTAEWQRYHEYRDLNSWLQGLKDTPYITAVEHSKTFEQFEQALVQHLLELKKDLFSVFNYSFQELLWKKYDLHNLKIFLKMKLMHKDLRHYLIPLGLYDIDQLEIHFLGDEKVDLPKSYLQMSEQAEKTYYLNNDLAAMDNYLDKVYFKEVSELAGKYGSELSSFYRCQIDEANFKIWWQQKNGNAVNISYIDNGNFSGRFFETSLELTSEQMLAKIFPELKEISSAEEALLQKKIDDYIADRIFRKRFTNNGILPVFIFLRAKENEIKNLKTYYLKQAKNLSKLADYLREVYV